MRFCAYLTILIDNIKNANYIPSSRLVGTKTEYKITVGPWPFSDQNTGLTN